MAAVVTQSGKRYEIRITGLRLSAQGEIETGPEALIQVECAGKAQRLLPPGCAILPEGWDGIRQCIRFVARQYCKAGAEAEVEWWPEEHLEPRLRRRLLGMAGGLVKSVQMKPEERCARARRAAKARHERPIAPVRWEVSTGDVEEAWAVREGRGRWVVRRSRNGVVCHEMVRRSRVQAEEWIRLFSELPHYLKLMDERARSGEGAPIE